MSQPAPDFTHTSFERHAGWYAERAGELEALFALRSQGWLDTVDGWRHQRMVALCGPLMADGTEWITVGDGTFGCDAWLLERLGARAIATDISPTYLEFAHARGFVRDYRVANVEALPFADQSCDYVLCKESWHHFPRPYLGLYEMLRVARRGVVLVEPVDPLLAMPLLLALTNLADRIHPKLMQRVWKNRFSFEPVGNYVYKLTAREMEKVAMGLALPALGYLGVNDYYRQAWTRVPMAATWAGRLTRAAVAAKDAATALGLIPPQQLAVVLWKQAPSEGVRQGLRRLGARVTDLPRNPYTR